MSSITEDDALKLLNITKGASLEDIDRAFKKAAKKAHPDSGGSDEAFIKITNAKQKLTEVAIQNGTPQTTEKIAEKEDLRNVIVLDDAFFLLEHEKDFRAWRKPNMKIMGILTAKNRDKETEMIVDYCSKGYGTSYQAIESYLTNEAGITSPYKMNERVLAVKRIVEAFKHYMTIRG